MKILAISTSSSNASVSLLENDTVIKELNNTNERTHSEKLMPLIDELLKNCNISLSDIDLIACDVGPGSFTGIRIGVATVKAIAEVNQIPIAQCSSLEALSYIGKRGMGALEFVPSINKDELNKEQTIEIESLVEVANQVLNDRENVEYSLENASLKQLISVGSSIGGARAKAIVAIDKDGNIKSGQIAGLKDHEYCIIKFDGLGADLTEEKNVTYFTRIEYAYYLMAKAAGIHISESSLLKKNGKYHFKTRRFDRDSNGNKIHMLSLAGIAGFDFKHPGEDSYEEASIVLRRIGGGYQDLKQLFLRMVFNVICKNHDDHVKNISFLMDKDGKFFLSPAYDLTYSYKPKGDWTKHHQMTINNKVDDFVLQDLVNAGLRFGLKERDIKDCINSVKESAKMFLEFAKQAELPDNIAKIIYNDFVWLE